MKKLIILLFTALLFMACEQQSNEKAKTKKKVIDAVGVDTVQPTHDTNTDAGDEPQVQQTPEAPQQVQQTPEAPQVVQNVGGEAQVQQTPEAPQQVQQTPQNVGGEAQKKEEEVADVQVPFVSFEANKAEFRQSVFKYIYENPPPNNDNNLGLTYYQRCMGQVRLFLKSKGITEPTKLSKARGEGSTVCWDYIYDKDGRAVHLTTFDNEFKAYKKAEDAKKASP